MRICACVLVKNSHSVVAVVQPPSERSPITLHRCRVTPTTTLRVDASRSHCSVCSRNSRNSAIQSRRRRQRQPLESIKHRRHRRRRRRCTAYCAACRRGSLVNRRAAHCTARIVCWRLRSRRRIARRPSALRFTRYSSLANPDVRNFFKKKFFLLLFSRSCWRSLSHASVQRQRYSFSNSLSTSWLLKVH